MKKIFALLALAGFIGLAGGCRYEEHERVVEKAPADRPVDVHVHDYR